MLKQHQKQLVTLYKSIADNFAQLERCFLQLSRISECETELQEEQESFGSRVLSRFGAKRTKPQWPIGDTIQTEEEAKRYGHPVGSTLHVRIGSQEVWSEPGVLSYTGTAKHDASKLSVADSKDDMEIRPVQISNTEGGDTYFVPATPKDAKGMQIGVLSNNRYGIAVLENPMTMIEPFYPNEEIESITKEIHQK